MVVAADLDPAQRTAYLIPGAVLHRAWPPLARPYKQLFTFTEDDAGDFHGREAFVAELRQKLAERPLVAVGGPSGTDKSSVIFAGLLPQLRTEGGWLIADMRPGERPLHRLAEALAGLASPDADPGSLIDRTEEWAGKLGLDPGFALDAARRSLAAVPRGRNVLLVIDQFEELFTLCHDKEQRDRFVAVLARIAAQPVSGHLRAVLTLRADWLEPVLQDRRLADALKDADVKLGPMLPEELGEAIEAPARNLGVGLAPRLKDSILGAMAQGPDLLPLMEFALHELVGGAEGAAAHQRSLRGDRWGGGCPRKTCRPLLRRARRPGPGRRAHGADATRAGREAGRAGGDTRRPRTLAEFGEALWPMVLKLAEARLVVVGENRAEIVHEALIRRWKQLRDWLDEDRAFLLWGASLEEQVRKFATDSDAFRLRGGALAEAERWQAQRTLRDDEQAFIKASRDAENREKAAKIRQQGLVRRLLGGLLGLAVLVAAGLGFGLYRVNTEKANTARALADVKIERDRASEAAAEAERQKVLAVAALAEAERAAASEKVQRDRAEDEGMKAQNAAEEALVALAEAHEKEVRYLTASAESELRDGLATNAILLALEALPAQEGAPGSRVPNGRCGTPCRPTTSGRC